MSEIRVYDTAFTGAGPRRAYERVMRPIASLLRLFLFATAMFGCALSSFAGTFTFNPNDGVDDPDDFNDLDHYKYYTWGFKGLKSTNQNLGTTYVLKSGEVVLSATLTITQINNWDNNPNWLNMWLLDRAASSTLADTYHSGTTADGLVTAYDDADGSMDIFAGSGWQSTSSVARTKIATYTDTNGGPNGNLVNLTYTFSPALLSALNSYITNGNDFALGFDPDCHYYNTGIKFQITTGAAPHYVPEGGMTVALLGLGCGAMMFGRRFVRGRSKR